MKVCLVQHKYSVDISDPCCYPLGFMYISSILKSLGHEVKVLNYNLFNYDLVNEIKSYDIAMFTGFEEFLQDIKRDAAICKNLGIKTILGGALATFYRDKMLDYVDTVVVGEGDNCVGKALTYNGILFGTRPNLNEIPYPDYEGFGIAEYNKRHDTNYISILTSRGCPFSCTFCSHTCIFQYRNLSKVFEEIDLYISKYHTELISINDNTVNINKDRFLELCSNMKARKLLWGASIRCDNFDESMAKAAKESGCIYFVVGVETFKQEKLDRLNKKLKVNQIYSTLDLLHKYDIDYHGNILVGFEDESYQDIQDEIAALPKWCKIFPVLVQPFIGTKNGSNRKISKIESCYLASIFKEYSESQNKFNYSEVV